MGTFRLTHQAHEDFEKIGLYTLESWGEDQAVLYLTKLDETFSALAHSSAMGKARNDLLPGLLSCPCSQHAIFFRRHAQGNVDILRILHQRMDFERHLQTP